MGKRNGFDFGDFEITKREIIASISIFAIMMLIGIVIAGKISDYQLDKNEIYNKAIKIESQDLFEYGMRTDVGNAFVYGELKTIDAVTYPEIGRGYMYIEKVKERYTMHTRKVPHTTTVNGKTSTYYTTEVYWTWDRVNSEDKHCKEVSFLEVIFDSKKIKTPSADYIETIQESSHVRYKYYGTGLKFTGTIFTELKNGTISDNTSFYNNKNLAETVEYLETDISTVIFWLTWLILTCFCIYGFYYIDNEWLE